MVERGRNRAVSTVAAATAVLATLVAAPVLAAPPLPDAAAIDGEVLRLMEAEDVKGLALAVIDEGEIVHLAAHGHRNVERELPLTTDTVMYGASLTKTAFAYYVLQLVDEGRFDLDRPLHEYLPKPLPEYEDYTDLAGDQRWQTLTARHVLTHSTGFANFRWLEEDRKLRFHFAPGARYGYSGEGFYLLQFALEEGLGLDTKAETQRRLFDRFDMPNTSLQWRADFADNLADGYGIDGTFEPHDERSNVSGAGSMDTTIADQATRTFEVELITPIAMEQGLRFAIRSLRSISRGSFPVCATTPIRAGRRLVSPRGWVSSPTTPAPAGSGSRAATTPGPATWWFARKPSVAALCCWPTASAQKSSTLQSWHSFSAKRTCRGGGNTAWSSAGSVSPPDDAIRQAQRRLICRSAGATVNPLPATRSNRCFHDFFDGVPNPRINRYDSHPAESLRRR